MYYASVSFLAILILFFTNRDIMFKVWHSENRQTRAYHWFMRIIAVYYIADILWGVFDFAKVRGALYADTVIYFLAMGATVLFWCKYLVTYLETKPFFSKLLVIWARVLIAGLAIMIIVNFFIPVFFYYDEAMNYAVGPGRYALIIIYSVTFFVTFLYALINVRKQNANMRTRYRAIGLFGLIMTILIIIQIFTPLLPLYAIGLLLGSCLLHSFVIDAEKAEAHKELEQALAREQEQNKELWETRRLAYTDSLTGIRNKTAYLEKVDALQVKIKDDQKPEFAIAVFDLNKLKIINDTLGHESGDKYIINACKIICDMFKHSPVFRVGGDEFVAILEGKDYRSKDMLLEQFQQMMVENVAADDVVVAIGIAQYISIYDRDYHAVFERADKEMYKNKRDLKRITE